MKRLIYLVLLSCCLAGGMTSLPAQASGGSGGGSSGGGSGGASKSPVFVTATVPLSNGLVLVNGVYPQGQETFGYSTDGSVRTFAVSVSNLNLPDGTPLAVRLAMYRSVPAYPGDPVGVLMETGDQYILVVSHGQAALAVSTARGDHVPDFPQPGSGITCTALWVPGIYNSILSAWWGHLAGFNHGI